MSTYRELYERTKERLKEQGLFEYESNAWILFSYVTKLSKLDYILKSDKEATSEQKVFLDALVKERITGRPVQYITGETEFMGYRFMVNENVLIPRFDTEILVDKAYKYLQSISKPKVLDMCTGSGCIIISLAKLLQSGKYIGVDISSEALKVADANNKELETFVEFIQSDLFEKVEGQFDLIVSNPPYITNADIEALEEEVKLYEPRLALSGGDDGLIFYRKIVNESKKFLVEGGCLMLEIGYDQGEAVSELLKAAAYTEIQVIKDLAGLDRVVVARVGGKSIC